MKKFKASFEIEPDDDWSKEDVDNMLNTLLEPMYHLGDVFIGRIRVEEIEVEEVK